MNRLVLLQACKRLFSTSTTTAVKSSFSGLNEANYASRPIEELLPLIATFFDARDYERGRQLVQFCRQRRPQDWQRAMHSAAIPNMIFKAALEQESSTSAELTAAFQTLRRDLKLDARGRSAVKPDSLTFALMFKYLILRWSGSDGGENAQAQEIENDLKYLRGEAEAHGFTFEVVLEAMKEAQFHEQVQQLKQIFGMLDVKKPDSVSTSTSLPHDQPPLRLIEMPEVRTVASKSEGISFIKDSLKQLLQVNPDALSDPMTRYQLQMRLEQDCYAAMIAKVRREAEALAQVHGTGNLKNIRKDLLEWHEALKARIQQEFDGRSQVPAQSSAQLPQDFSFYVALLSTLDAEKISIIVIQELLKLALYEPFFLSAEDGAAVPIQAARLVTLSTAIGTALQREIFAAQIARKPFLNRAQLSPLALARLFNERGGGRLDQAMRRVYAKLEGDLEAQRDGWIPAWSSGLRAEVGSFLLALVESCLFKGDRAPIFKHCVVYSGNSKKLGVIRIDDEVLERLQSDRQIAYVEAWAMPMLVPPKPWLTLTSGGYLTHKNTCVRLKDDPVHLALLADSQREGQMDRVLMGLDVLGSIPWTINEPILRVAIELWNQGVNVSELQSQSLESCDFPFKKRDDFGSPEEYRDYCRRASAYRDAQTRQHSMTCDTNYKLEIARTFAGVPFYLPHSVDFRGRAYPIPPHLSHIGSDLSRGLLKFAEGRALGRKGLFWLKVQFANMCGVDKCSLEERVAFADSKRAEIAASAQNPLAPDAFWRSADEPWQCLATCLEIFEAERSGAPEAFISHLPVQQDGSCNGSQHYAALGGDVEGAKQVNLTPTPTPQDIYGTVARIVSREVDRDCEAGAGAGAEDDEVTQKVASLLRGRITRKIVKQPVMTNIYGVTLYGAKKQIEARLREFSLIPAEDEALMRRAREYLTVKVFAALDELFVQARKIQGWLEFCATEICRALPHDVAVRYEFTPSKLIASEAELEETRKMNANTWNPCREYAAAGNELQITDRFPQTSVSWTTPLAFRVLQPYLKTSSVQFRTVLQLCSLQQSNQFDAVDAAKQVAAFPPNFIHSLDATHMFKTALACYEAGVTFASVHDCFWTHAATVDEMSHVLRREFVAMHSEPILERLREEFCRLYEGYKVPVVLKTGKRKVWREIFIPELPKRGDFDLKQVLESRYFFS